MLDKCDVYLPSTCFSGMKAYNRFESLPNRRWYWVIFYKEQQKLKNLFFDETNWEQISFYSTNSALNLRTDLIESVMINNGFYDK